MRKPSPKTRGKLQVAVVDSGESLDTIDLWVQRYAEQVARLESIPVATSLRDAA